jgi:hypothetical protein
MRALPIASSLLAGLLFLLPAHAQTVPLNSEISIAKIDAALVDTPKIPGGGYTKKGQPRPGKWLEIEVTFDHNKGAKDSKVGEELTFNYYILLNNKDSTEDRKQTLLTGSVTHEHVPPEKALHSVAFVSPRTLAKLFDGKPPVNAQQAVFDVGVTVTGKEGLLAISTFKGTVKGDKGWWDGTPTWTALPGQIRNKDQTPFAPLEWDYFEPVKIKSQN